MYLLHAGGLAQGGLSDDTNPSKARRDPQLQSCGNARRTQNVEPAHTQRQGERQRLLHVSDKHNSNEEPSRLH